MRKKLMVGLVILLLVFSTVVTAMAQRGSRTAQRMSTEDLKDSVIYMLTQLLKDPDKTVRIYAIKGLTT